MFFCTCMTWKYMLCFAPFCQSEIFTLRRTEFVMYAALSVLDSVWGPTYGYSQIQSAVICSDWVPGLSALMCSINTGNVI